MADNNSKSAEGSPTGRQSATFTPPTLTLPKGGGAIRGIGEKFSSNLVNGTGAMSVPIVTSPGRSGFDPELALSYDSGAGNGPFGFGWSPSLPAITRKTDKGLPQYDDANESDVFILSGAEDLVPVLDKDNGWARVPLKKPNHAPEHRIDRYRPRTEGLFARIERWTHLTTGDMHWRTITRDNITTIYGKNNASRIFDPTDPPTDHPRRIFSWLICESYDDKGNVILYEYQRENSVGVSTTQANEQNRTDASRSSNIYLKRIKYGNTESHFVQPDAQKLKWHFEVVLDYDDGHYQLVNAPDQDPHFVRATLTNSPDWNVRQDPFSTYRSGFEVRTYRLCRRVLLFHHFDELPTNEYLVRSTEFAFESSTVGSFITSVTQSGYVWQADGTFLKKSLPPLEFGYSKPPSEGELAQIEVHEIDTTSLENLPYGLDGSSYQWVDLDGEGVSGILTEQAETWFYKRNCGDGEFAPLEIVASKPSIANLASRQQLLDLAGDGQLDLVALSRVTPGFFERTNEERWRLFTPFESLPAISWDDPNLRFVDLTGDGHTDVLISRQGEMVWYPSLAEQGFGSALSVSQSADEEKGPRLVFADGTQSIYLADMSGDGLSDLVRIENGHVSYFPNLGYGRFGARVTMDDAPWFDTPDLFDQKRIRLADVDGSGITDVLYLGRDGIDIYLNESGNSWRAKRTLPQMPITESVSAVTPVDLFGSGTTCIVWSSPLPGNARRAMRYLDLMARPGQDKHTWKHGQKPYLLISVKNNLGAETRVEYVPSTYFYLQDREKGQPWITRLPFPVHVVERVETYDLVSRNRFVTRYAYHHGYFDGTEREFRGFGLVEQRDTDELGALEGGTVPQGENFDDASYVPPVCTKTWFHTGVFLPESTISRQYIDEYYGAPIETDPKHDDKFKAFEATLLPDTQFPDSILFAPQERTSWAFSTEELRQACRALKGSILRQEIYAEDESNKREHPYTVSERNYAIEVLQPMKGNRHAVFFTHASETLDYHFERNPQDPRTSHQIVLETDAFGNVCKSVTIGYGRNADQVDVADEDLEKQTTRLITYTESVYTNAIEAALDYRTPLPAEIRTYELTRYPFQNGLERYNEKDFVELKNGTIALVFENEILYEEKEKDPRTRRLVEHVRTLYRKNDLTGALPLPGATVPVTPSLDSRALPFESYKLAFTPGLLTDIYKRPKAGGGTEDLIPDPGQLLGVQGKYLASQTFKAAHLFPESDTDDHWWIPSGCVHYSNDATDTAAQELAIGHDHFYLPRLFLDPFDHVTVVRYDEYDLLILETQDAADNKITAGNRNADGSITNSNDYRVLQPELVTDPNGNRSQVAFDALGMVVATAVMGKEIEPDGKAKGDEIGAALKRDLTNVEIQNFFAADPRILGRAFLDTATTRVVYDLDAFRRSYAANPDTPDKWLPAFAATISRETHFHALGNNRLSELDLSFSYSDGFGREIQKKIQAEPGPLEPGGPNQDPRWVGSGWTIFNNKGKPVRKYEPFFDDTHAFKFGNKVGVSSILFYDPLERVVATLHPNHTYEKTIFTPWQQETWDVNDTVPESDPKNDPDVRDFFRRLPDVEYLPTWHALRTDPAYVPERAAKWKDARQQTSEANAAVQAEAHKNTSTTAHFDVLGRTFLTFAHNGFRADASPIQFATHIMLDIEGNQRQVSDAKDRAVMRYSYDMLGNRIRQESMDAGTRWMLNDVAGKPIRTWDSLDHTISTKYDALRRPTEVWVAVGVTQPILAERTVYGETLPDPETHNLRSKTYQVFDGAGTLKNEEYDFKGNLLRSTRQLIKDYRLTADWNAAPVLEGEIFSASTRYDALNRVIQQIAPHSNRPGVLTNVVQPSYNEANLLEKVNVWLQTAEPGDLLDPATASLHAVSNIDYDAKGQRRLIQYGNGTSTEYEYDSDTLRLTHLFTARGAAFPGDCPDPTQPPCGVQNLYYTYDPVGNITEIRDEAQPKVFFKNIFVEANNTYKYDPVYRLIEAHGREHLGQVGGCAVPPNAFNTFHTNLAQQQNGDLMGKYTEWYDYDKVGNFEAVRHHTTDPQIPDWTRTYEYLEKSPLAPDDPNAKSNRLTATNVGGNREAYLHDAHGNMIRMPHLALGANAQQPNMHWDFEDQLNQADLGGGGTAYYAYDAGGQRVRKVIDRQNGNRQEERLYLGGFEIHRTFNGNGNTLTLERETLNVMDDKQRVALVEMRTVGNEPNTPAQLVRFQLDNHLGSAVLELNELSEVISYEEYYPYGSTSYQAVRKDIDVPLKRYRFTGKERDEESGFYYHGARYYSPWLGRWISGDPIGIDDHINLYVYTRDNPINGTDPHGLWTWRKVAVIAAAVTVGVVVTVATAGAAAPVAAAAVASLGLSGAAATVATGVAVGAVAGAVGGAAAGAASETTRQVVHGEKLSGGKILREAGYGAAIGGAVGAAIPLAAAALPAAGGAIAGTSTGAAVIAGTRAAAGRVAATAVGRLASAAARGGAQAVRSLASQPGVRHIVQAARSATQSVGRGLQAVEQAGRSVGTRVAQRAFGQGASAASTSSATAAAGAELGAVEQKLGHVTSPQGGERLFSGLSDAEIETAMQQRNLGSLIEAPAEGVSGTGPKLGTSNDIWFHDNLRVQGVKGAPGGRPVNIRTHSENLKHPGSGYTTQINTHITNESTQGASHYMTAEGTWHTLPPQPGNQELMKQLHIPAGN